jgi:hypothetical protein
MEMPKSCLSCPLQGGTADCRLTQKTYNWGLPERPSDCPLVPVPPHYDLIDHNALKIAVMDCDAETRIDFLKHAMDCINKAPVVIPSDIPTYEAEEGER